MEAERKRKKNKVVYLQQLIWKIPSSYKISKKEKRKKTPSPPPQIKKKNKQQQQKP